jgi:hypothetical protein
MTAPYAAPARPPGPRIRPPEPPATAAPPAIAATAADDTGFGPPEPTP